MIVPMTRYGFLLYHGDVPLFLEHLRELGMVDITTLNWQGNDHERELLTQTQRLMAISKAMRSVVPSGEAYGSAELAAQEWEKATTEIASLDGDIARYQKEASEAAVWGEFDPKVIDALRQKGVTLRFFEVAAANYKPEWEDDYAIEVVGETVQYKYFVIAQQKVEPIEISAVEVRTPTFSVTEKEAQIEQCIARQGVLQAILARAAGNQKDVLELSLEYQEQLDFSQIVNAGESYGQGSMKILEGFCQSSDAAKIEAFAQGEQVIFTSEKASVEQNPPIKLKNNFFARLYEPIGSLYMNPRYDELDMTPYFAPFFMIFFGMCLGDAGYGFLFMAAIMVLWKKVERRYRDFLWLGIFLSFSGMIFGFLSGNLAGMSLANIKAFDSVQSWMLLRDPNTVFYFSIALGGVQILFGQVLRIFNRIKRGGSYLYGLSSLGWVILFISALTAFGVDNFLPDSSAMLGTSSLSFYIGMAVAGVLILFFAAPDKNIFVSFAKGVYSIYEMATGVVGDLISYVRLFAIGLAGAIIAQVFNELAVGLSGNIPVLSWILMAVILIIGHGLNIFISSLGAFVHPVRLTFVEFYKNAEFDGGGRSFDPFRRKKINN
ncbi:MAG: hypothetical protein RR066_07365 [Mucinivorans sp.]